jgi:hypothetical protein
MATADLDTLTCEPAVKWIALNLAQCQDGKPDRPQAEAANADLAAGYHKVSWSALRRCACATPTNSR